MKIVSANFITFYVGSCTHHKVGRRLKHVNNSSFDIDEYGGADNNDVSIRLSIALHLFHIILSFFIFHAIRVDHFNG